MCVWEVGMEIVLAETWTTPKVAKLADGCIVRRRENETHPITPKPVGDTVCARGEGRSSGAHERIEWSLGIGGTAPAEGYVSRGEHPDESCPGVAAIKGARTTGKTVAPRGGDLQWVAYIAAARPAKKTTSRYVAP